MEHRNGSRIPVCLNVSLWKGGKNLGWYCARDIGPGGLSIKGALPELRLNSLVKVSIETVQNNRFQLLDYRALVVHKNVSSMGFMWTDYEISLPMIIPEAIRRAA
ncbi:MAG: PilZ domain-containing protein [Pseudohongiellaceae bacterium]